MRKTTKFLTLVLAVIMTVSMFVTGASAAFEDVDYTTAEGDAVNLLVSLGVTKGTTETKFGTAENVTRQQMAAFIYRLMKAGKSVEGGVNSTTFTDLTDSTFFYMVSWANQTGVIKGVSDTKFNPTGNITLQDAYTMVVRALGYEADGALSYPFGYIEKAEEIGLDEDLPATLGYTDVLTRGNVAVILANAFYADMATYEIAYESLGYSLVGNDGKSYDDGAVLPETIIKNGVEVEFEIVSAFSKGQKPYNKYDTVASKIFGVEKTVQYVVATPSFTLDGEELEEADVEMIKFNPNKDGTMFGFDAEDDDVSADDYAIETIEFAELGLDGKADDYFLAGIELYIKRDEATGEKEVLGATSLMTKKTVKGEDITFGTLKGSADSKFYTNDEVLAGEYTADDEDYDGTLASDYRRLNGLVTIDGVKTYLYDAPYSYAKPEKLAEINADNAQFLSLGVYDGEYEDEDEPIEVKFNYNYGTIFDEGYEDDADNAALETFAQAIFGGLYEMDVYDIDGDGRYELINYKPYAVAEIDDAEDEALIDYAFDEHGNFDYDWDNAIVYTDRTIVTGVEAADKDIVLAVISPAGNFVDIKAVLEPTEATVTGLATKYAKFDSGEKHEFAYADFAVYNASSVLANPDNFAIDTEAELYFYEGKLVYAGDIATKVNFNEDWVVVLEALTTETAVKDGDKIVKDQYVQIYHDGEIKDVKAKKITAEMVEKTRWEDYPVTFGYNAEEDKDMFDFSEYVGKLAIAKTDAKGAYYFELLDMGLYNDVTVLANDKDADEESDDVYAFTVENVALIKKSGYNYIITEDGESTYSDFTDDNDNANTFRQVTVKDYTQIIIKTYDEDEAEVVFEVYGYDNLPNFADDFYFDKATVLVANNNGTVRNENLVVFYAETEAELEASKGDLSDFRVVLSYESYTEDDETVWSVNTFDPATGATETLEAAEGVKENFKKGYILAKTTEGYLADDEVFGNVWAEGAVDLDTVDEDDKVGTLGFVKIENFDASADTIELNKATFDEDGEFLAWEEDGNTYTVTKDTVYLEYDNSDASVKAATVDALSSTASKWNKDQKKDSETVTGMCAFISAVEDEDADDEGYYFVRYVVIVHN